MQAKEIVPAGESGLRLEEPTPLPRTAAWSEVVHFSGGSCGLAEWSCNPQLSFRSCLAGPPERQRPKKQVVFADTRGLALISVHTFEDVAGRAPEEGWCPVPSFPEPPSPVSPESPTCSLDFCTQSKDPRGFQRRVQTQGVSLEQCSEQRPSCRAPGTEWVQPQGLQEVVWMRMLMAFNAGGSFQEVTYVYGPHL
ncbi:protein phosphatase 1 regulatory subunit 3C-like [Callospermophilus lateralis]|uniref:protein phosphatase 1 regulatory subunit 3C-like n=1 Tax=Callospermophilus lateralis TaxID=76772 RepID=UPI0040386B18